MSNGARVVKLVDTADLKSADPKRSYRFDSGSGHHDQQAHQPFFIAARPQSHITGKFNATPAYTCGLFSTPALMLNI